MLNADIDMELHPFNESIMNMNHNTEIVLYRERNDFRERNILNPDVQPMEPLEDIHKTVTLKFGYIGIDILEHNGQILKVKCKCTKLLKGEACADCRPVQKSLLDAKITNKDYKIIKIDSEDYSIELLRKKKNGSTNYKIEIVKLQQHEVEGNTKMFDSSINRFLKIIEKLPKNIIGHYIFHFLGHNELDNLENLKDVSKILRDSFDEMITSRRIAQLFDTDMLPYHDILQDTHHMYRHQHNKKLDFFIETNIKSQEDHNLVQDVWKMENFNLQRSFNGAAGRKNDEFGFCLSKPRPDTNALFVPDANNANKETIAFAKFSSADIEVTIEELELHEWITIVSEFETDVLISDKETYIKKKLEPSKYFKYMVKEIVVNDNGETKIRAGIIRSIYTLKDDNWNAFTDTDKALANPQDLAQFDFWITQDMMKNIKKSKRFHQSLMITKFKKKIGNIEDTKKYCTVIFDDWERSTSTNSNRRENGKSIEMEKPCESFDIIFKQEQNQIVVRYTEDDKTSKVIAILENPSSLKIRMRPYEQGFYFYRHGMRRFDN